MNTLRPLVLRWGRSSYETDAQIRDETDRAAALGCDYVVSTAREPVELSKARVLVVPSGTQVDAEVLKRAPELELVVTTTSGYDHMDLSALRIAGVRAARCPVARRDAVVEAATGMALHLLRDFGGLTEAGRTGEWARGTLPERQIASLRGLSVGILGLGVIGRRQAEVLQAFGAEVAGFDTAPVAIELPRKQPHELFATSRVLFVHCNHRPGRPPVVDSALLRAARTDLILINTARGGVLDVDAALEALRAGRLGGLGVDVFPDEPWPAMAAFAREERIVATPHAAGYYDGLGGAVASEVAAALKAWRSEEPLPARLI